MLIVIVKAFWGAFAVGRFIGIPIMAFITPETYLMIVLIVGIIGIAPNMFFIVQNITIIHITLHIFAY